MTSLAKWDLFLLRRQKTLILNLTLPEFISNPKIQDVWYAIVKYFVFPQGQTEKGQGYVQIRPNLTMLKHIIAFHKLLEISEEYLYFCWLESGERDSLCLLNDKLNFFMNCMVNDVNFRPWPSYSICIILSVRLIFKKYFGVFVLEFCGLWL